MSSWQCDDKAWMKQRRVLWKTVQKRVNELRFLNKEFKPAVKHYFLTGEDIDDYYCMQRLDIGPLIEMWFDPDRSGENWQRIKKKYSERKWADSKMRFFEVANELGFSYLRNSTESFFDGLEERLYDLFFYRGLKREYYPALNEDEFQKKAWNSYRLAANIDMFFYYREHGNPYNVINFQLEEWHDAIILAFDPERVELIRVVQDIDKALALPDEFCEHKVVLAKRVAAILDDPELPQAAKDKIAEIRARPCHPDCEIES